MAYLTWKQKKEVMTDINEVALVLLEFYISKLGTSDYSYADDVVAKALEWTERKVGENRRKLTKYKYFRQEVTKNNTTTHVETFIGERWKKTT